MFPFSRDEQKFVLSILSREKPIEALPELLRALARETHQVPLSEIAIGLDTNAFLRLGNSRKADEVIDYLALQHRAPLILPGQVIQEFWNNQLSAVDTLYGGLKKKFDGLKAELAKFGEEELVYAADIKTAIERFGLEYLALYSVETRRATARWLEALQGKAVVPYVSRAKFALIAQQRRRTKTPPGFKDEGDGDFYVWADFLLGLLQANKQGISFKKAVLVSDDKKVDWVRDGIAHPILSAELASCLGVPFQIWSSTELIKAVGTTQEE